MKSGGGSSWLLDLQDEVDEALDDDDDDDGGSVDKGFGWLPGMLDDDDVVDDEDLVVDEDLDADADADADADDKKKKKKKKPSKKPDPRKRPTGGRRGGRGGRSEAPSAPSLSPLGSAVVGTAAGALVFRSFELPGGVILGSLLGGVVGYFGGSFMTTSEGS